MAQSTVEYPKRDVESQVEQAPIFVLHVDDEAGFLKAAKQILEMQGAFQVDTASSVEEAQEKMRQKPYDVIVSDYIMHGKDGLEFLQELRDGGSDIPFIIFTGKGREIVAIKALNLGADQYVNKIGSPEVVYSELAHGIRQVTEKRRVEEERDRLLYVYGERVKELRCLYGMSKLFERIDVPIEKLLQETADLLPPAYQYPEITCARVVFEGREFKTKNFRETSWIQQAVIIVNKENVGTVEVHYLKERPLIDEGPFPKEERDLINAVSERLAKIIVLKQTEEKMRESEENYRNIFELAPDSIVTLDRKGVVTSCNAVGAKMLGYSKDEIVGKHISKLGFLRARDMPNFLRMLYSAVRGKVPKPFEVTCIRKDGTPYLGEVRFSLIKKHRKTIGFQVISREIIERKKAEEELKESENRLKILFENSPDGLVLSKLSGVTVDTNKALDKLMGFERKETVGKNFFELGLISKRQIPKALKLLAKIALRRPAGPSEFTVTRKDGSQIAVEIRMFPVKLKGEILMLGSLRDISQRKKAEEELKKTLERLETLNEKLGVVGKLARHDARNKLSAVTMNAFLIKQKLAHDPEALQHLSEIESACGDVEKIFEFASIYEKIGVEELAYMNVEKTLEETVRLFSDLQGAKVVNDCHGLTVLSDSLLRQLFYNLIDNSLKHGAKVSRIRVHFQDVEKDQLDLIYEDDGIGIPKADKERVFEEGYGKGTGYGLYLIRKMCDVYGWTIRETGKQGKGAQFTITIPQVGESGKANYQLR